MKNTNKIISLISNIRDKANRLIVKKLEENEVYDLTPSNGDILFALFYAKELLTMKDIAKKINRDKSTITSLINKLVKLGYIQKLKSNDDARSTIVVLTKKGWELEPIFNTVSEQLISTVYGGFSSKQKEEAIDVLEKIYKNL